MTVDRGPGTGWDAPRVRRPVDPFADRDGLDARTTIRVALVDDAGEVVGEVRVEHGTDPATVKRWLLALGERWGDVSALSQL